MQYKIFCDMDGVLTDFSKAYLDLTGVDLAGRQLNDKNFWEPIDKAGVPFWEWMNWEPDGKDLWNVISKYNPTILSAPSRKIDSKIGKYKWVERELPGVDVIFRSAERKKEFAKPNHILIDDREDNIIGWIENGGEGILHNSAASTIKILNEKYDIY